MRFSVVRSLRVEGIRVELVSVEADVVRGLSHFTIVGLGDRSVSEARDRVSSAIRNSGYTSPKQTNQKVVVSLAPSEIKKIGSRYDLAIALSYLVASGQIPSVPKDAAFIGELSLDGKVCPVSGVLALVLGASRVGIKHVFVAEESFEEIAASHIHIDVRVHKVASLNDVVGHVCTDCVHIRNDSYVEDTEDHPFIGMYGMSFAKRAALIAAAGRHNIALVGPPGTGKSLLAHSIGKLVPDLSDEELFTVATIRSVAGENNPASRRPSFRKPHHGSSWSAIVGSASGTFGEITLAHLGVLFLDEVLEFDRRAIESLREPLEEGFIELSSANKKVRLPARCMLVVAMNPPEVSGVYAHSHSNKKKLSAAMVDRFDLWVEMTESEVGRERKNYSEIGNPRELVQAARLLLGNVSANPHAIDEYLKNSSDMVQNVVMNIAVHSKLSNRSVHKLIKVSRTIAALDARTVLTTDDVLEAATYRERNVL